MTLAQLPEPVVRSLQTNAKTMASNWQQEIPLQIHDRAIGGGGTPRWSQDFRRYIQARTSGDRGLDDDPRLRTTRAFRLLRRKAVREFEVAYQIVVLRGGHVTAETLQDTADWLNARCERNGIPDRYSRNDVLLMLHSALDKVTKWW